MLTRRALHAKSHAALGATQHSLFNSSHRTKQNNISSDFKQAGLTLDLFTIILLLIIIISDPALTEGLQEALTACHTGLPSCLVLSHR